MGFRRYENSCAPRVTVRPPPLTDRQRRLGLVNAQHARMARARMLQQLKASHIGVRDVLDAADRDEIIARIKVVDLMKSLPGVGPVGAQRLLDGIGIDSARRLGGLRARQRQELIDATTYPIQWRKKFRS
ncbi:MULTISPECIES: integration host factor, actinobacterial type [Rhodococcus]|uniref:integration host factor, actinobacterial type n=1 Tax=Rhodococcus TaxID=1827 RepID=UPI00272E851D|nr:integration host factor, actinobacterial type [Rhodococcus qingshengii]